MHYQHQPYQQQYSSPAPPATPPHKRPASVPAGMAGRDSPCVAWTWCPYGHLPAAPQPDPAPLAAVPPPSGPVHCHFNAYAQQPPTPQHFPGSAFAAEAIDHELAMLRSATPGLAAFVGRTSTVSVSPSGLPASHTSSVVKRPPSTPMRMTGFSPFPHYHHQHHLPSVMVGGSLREGQGAGSLMSVSEDRFGPMPGHRHFHQHHHQLHTFSTPVFGASIKSQPVTAAVAVSRCPSPLPEGVGRGVMSPMICATPDSPAVPPGTDRADSAGDRLLRPCSTVRFDAEFEFPCDVLPSDMQLDAADRVEKRLRQIEYHGKGTPGYKNYLQAVPKPMRQVGNPHHPVTPRAACNNSKRRFDTLVSAWRVALHTWDDVGDGSQRLMDHLVSWEAAGVVAVSPAAPESPESPPDCALQEGSFVAVSPATVGRGGAAASQPLGIPSGYVPRCRADDDDDGPPSVERTLQGETAWETAWEIRTCCGDEADAAAATSAATPQTESRKGLDRQPSPASPAHAGDMLFKPTAAAVAVSPALGVARVAAFQRLMKDTLEHHRRSTSPGAAH